MKNNGVFVCCTCYPQGDLYVVQVRRWDFSQYSIPLNERQTKSLPFLKRYGYNNPLHLSGDKTANLLKHMALWNRTEFNKHGHPRVNTSGNPTMLYQPEAFVFMQPAGDRLCTFKPVIYNKEDHPPRRRPPSEQRQRPQEALLALVNQQSRT